MKKQYKFNNNFNGLIEESVVDYYKSFDEIDNKMKVIIDEESDNYIIIDNISKKEYCPICLNEIDSLYCKSCNKSFKKRFVKNVDINNLNKLSSEEDINFSEYYAMFDIKDDKVLLYTFKSIINYKNPNSLIVHRNKRIELSEVFLIGEKEVIELINNKKFIYSDVDEFLKIDEIKDMFLSYFDVELLDIKVNNADKKMLDEIYNYLFYECYLCTNNLDKLKNVDLYKYCNIWKIKDISYPIKVSSITMFPIYYKQFEFLIKLKLYNMALFYPFEIKDGNNFNERFGIDKKYLNIMQKLNIDYHHFEALKLYNTDDINVLNFVFLYNYYICKIVNYIDVKELMKYISDNNINAYSYFDYINELKEQRYDLSDRKLLFPKDFNSSHDKLFTQSLILKDKEIDERIKSLSKIYSLNIYEDDNYIIFPASSIESLIDESSQMSNCVKQYCESISNKETQIFFMRSKKSINKSLVTIEVFNNKVIQALTKYNKEVNKGQKKVIDKFEKSLLSIKII